MEDSYTVHRRRKAAAKKRDKTPDPPRTREEVTEDEDETRAKMERMVEDTERMEQQAEGEGKQRDLTVPDEDDGRARRSPSLGKKTDSPDATEKSSVREAKNEADTAENRTAARESDVSRVTERKAEEKNNDHVEKSGGSAEEAEKPARSKKRVKEPAERQSYATDSSDPEGDRKKNLRRRKSPQVSKTKYRRDDADEDAEVVRKKRGTSRNLYSGSDEEYEYRKTSSKNRSEEKVRQREKRSSSRHRYPSDSDEGEWVPSRSPARSSTIKKQVIPLDNDSLKEDLIRAEREYLRREHSILEPELEDEVQETNLRRRRKGDAKNKEEEEEEEEGTKTTKEEKHVKKSWFSWLPFFGKKKEKVEEQEQEEPEHEKVPEPKKELQPKPSNVPEKVSIWEFFKALMFVVAEFKEFVRQNPHEVRIILELRNACINGLALGLIYCGVGGLIFRFTEGAFESFYKCGVKRVKRDFLDSLWNYSHNLKEEDWKNMARRKLMDFEEQIHTAHEAGVQTYSGQRSWTFLNSVVYCLTIVTTIGYGHIAPSTTTGRAITIVYAIFGIPMFLIILADFGKLFTRAMKFLWAFVRRLYYTGSCRKVRRTAPVQEVMKGVQLVYDLATFRRPSQMNPDELEEMRKHGNQPQTVLNLDGNMSQQPDTPDTPAMSAFDIDDEFNLPISVAIFILLGYIFVGATLFYMVEEWGFFESFYFVFISMSTIGFGDYVPKHPIYMMCSIIYLVFGLALTSMCINVVQVMLSDQFQHASQKIGATIGLQLAEDDGSVHAAAPPAVEIADVHSSGKDNGNKEKIAPKAKQEEDDL